MYSSDLIESRARLAFSLSCMCFKIIALSFSFSFCNLREIRNFLNTILCVVDIFLSCVRFTIISQFRFLRQFFIMAFEIVSVFSFCSISKCAIYDSLFKHYYSIIMIQFHYDFVCYSWTDYYMNARCNKKTKALNVKLG